MDLTNVPVLDEDEIAGFKTPQMLIDELDAQVEELGFEFLPRPKQAPPNITEYNVAEITNNTLSELYAQYTAHAQFVFGELAKARIMHKLLSTALKKLASTLKLKLFASNTSKDEIAARIQNDGLYQEYEVEVMKAWAMQEILDAHYKAYSSQAKALSRIVEIRKLEIGAEIRNYSIQNHRRPSSPKRDFRRESSNG